MKPFGDADPYAGPTRTEAEKLEDPPVARQDVGVLHSTCVVHSSSFPLASCQPKVVTVQVAPSSSVEATIAGPLFGPDVGL